MRKPTPGIILQHLNAFDLHQPFAEKEVTQECTNMAGPRIDDPAILIPAMF